MAWRKIQIKGIYVKGAKSKKTIKISLTDYENNLDELKEALEKRPTWKSDGYGENEREFYITFKGGIGEVYDDDSDEDIPPDYGVEPPKEDGEDEDAAPF